jgi:DNA-binding NarL/FixJ family response regulator
VRDRSFRLAGVSDSAEIHYRNKVKLTAREMRVCQLLLEACSIEMIAKEMGVAKRTVKSYFRSLFLKFGISDRYCKAVRLVWLLHHPEQIRREH